MENRRGAWPEEAVETAILRVPQGDLPWTFAGLWETWGPDKLATFSILTMDASPAISRLHDRQPVILADDAFEPWLDKGSITPPHDLDDNAQFVPVTPRMNSPHYVEPDCIQALTDPPSAPQGTLI
jgi:putative SOS response-associated peptidase YedK